jgi:hypothetical protein
MLQRYVNHSITEAKHSHRAADEANSAAVMAGKWLKNARGGYGTSLLILKRLVPVRIRLRACISESGFSVIPAHSFRPDRLFRLAHAQRC